eukprot:PhF_6_TR25501/c0_g1_i2/m.35539
MSTILSSSRRTAAAGGLSGSGARVPERAVGIEMLAAQLRGRIVPKRRKIPQPRHIQYDETTEELQRLYDMSISKDPTVIIAPFVTEKLDQQMMLKDILLSHVHIRILDLLSYDWSQADPFYGAMLEEVVRVNRGVISVLYDSTCPFGDKLMALAAMNLEAMESEVQKEEEKQRRREERNQAKMLEDQRSVVFRDEQNERKSIEDAARNDYLDIVTESKADIHIVKQKIFKRNQMNRYYRQHDEIFHDEKCKRIGIEKSLVEVWLGILEKKEGIIRLDNTQQRAGWIVELKKAASRGWGEARRAEKRRAQGYVEERAAMVEKEAKARTFVEYEEDTYRASIVKMEDMCKGVIRNAEKARTERDVIENKRKKLEKDWIDAEKQLQRDFDRAEEMRRQQEAAKEREKILQKYITEITAVEKSFMTEREALRIACDISYDVHTKIQSVLQIHRAIVQEMRKHKLVPGIQSTKEYAIAFMTRLDPVVSHGMFIKPFPNYAALHEKLQLLYSNLQVAREELEAVVAKVGGEYSVPIYAKINIINPEEVVRTASQVIGCKIFFEAADILNETEQIVVAPFPNYKEWTVTRPTRTSIILTSSPESIINSPQYITDALRALSYTYRMSSNDDASVNFPGSFYRTLHVKVTCQVGCVCPTAIGRYGEIRKPNFLIPLESSAEFHLRCAIVEPYIFLHPKTRNVVMAEGTDVDEAAVFPMAFLRLPFVLERPYHNISYQTPLYSFANWLVEIECMNPVAEDVLCFKSVKDVVEMRADPDEEGWVLIVAESQPSARSDGPLFTTKEVHEMAKNVRTKMSVSKISFRMLNRTIRKDIVQLIIRSVRLVSTAKFPLPGPRNLRITVTEPSGMFCEDRSTFSVITGTKLSAITCLEKQQTYHACCPASLPASHYVHLTPSVMMLFPDAIVDNPRGHLLLGFVGGQITIQVHTGGRTGDDLVLEPNEHLQLHGTAIHVDGVYVGELHDVPPAGTVMEEEVKLPVAAPPPKPSRANLDKKKPLVNVLVAMHIAFSKTSIVPLPCLQVILRSLGFRNTQLNTYSDGTRMYKVTIQIGHQVQRTTGEVVIPTEFEPKKFQSITHEGELRVTAPLVMDSQSGATQFSSVTGPARIGSLDVHQIVDNFPSCTITVEVLTSAVDTDLLILSEGKDGELRVQPTSSKVLKRAEPEKRLHLGLRPISPMALNEALTPRRMSHMSSQRGQIRTELSIDPVPRPLSGSALAVPSEDSFQVVTPTVSKSTRAKDAMREHLREMLLIKRNSSNSVVQTVLELQQTPKSRSVLMTGPTQVESNVFSSDGRLLGTLLTVNGVVPVKLTFTFAAPNNEKKLIPKKDISAVLRALTYANSDIHASTTKKLVRVGVSNGSSLTELVLPIQCSGDPSAVVVLNYRLRYRPGSEMIYRGGGFPIAPFLQAWISPKDNTLSFSNGKIVVEMIGNTKGEALYLLNPQQQQVAKTMLYHWRQDQQSLLEKKPELVPHYFAQENTHSSG